MSKLLADLAQLGEKLAEEHLPAPADVRTVLGGLVHFVETGELNAGAQAVVSDAEQAIEGEADAEVKHLEAELEAVRVKKAAAAAQVETPAEKVNRLHAEIVEAEGS